MNEKHALELMAEGTLPPENDTSLDELLTVGAVAGVVYLILSAFDVI